MTNPTLLAQDTPWAGWSVTNLLENVLNSRGLTLNSADNTRVIATSIEQGNARARVHRAVTELTTRWPSMWLERQYSVTWTSGDHSIALPQNCAVVQSVFYYGERQEPLTREAYNRFIKPDAQGGGFRSSSTKGGWYRVTGVTSVTGGTPDPYYAPVLRLVPTPTSPDDTRTLIVNYLCKSPDFASGDDAKVIELDDLFVQWVAERAKEIWGTDEGMRQQHDDALAARTKLEDTIFLRLEGTGEYPDCVTWKYPTLPDNPRR